jgi:nitrate/nitrite transporter NarK
MRKRRGVLALLVALSVITFLDRLCIAAAGPLMQDELGIPPEKWGLLTWTSLIRDHDVAVILLTLGFGVMDLMLPSAWAICLDIGGEHAGAVSGAMNSSGQLGGFSCTVLFGFLVSRYGDYNLPLRVIAVMLLIAAVLFTRIDPRRPIIASAPRPDPHAPAATS